MSRANESDPSTPTGDDHARPRPQPWVTPNFIHDIIERDLREGTHHEIVTRFPPEPNGFAHIGHAFASFLDFGLAHDFNGRCHLRFDDTNPEVEEMRFVHAIEADLRWLGWSWERTHFASDYFEQLYQLARKLIGMGDAYVDSLSSNEIQRFRGTVEQAGQPSPYRDRSVAENLDLFGRMRAGEFADGTHVLRAKINLASANMKMRDPLLYRIVHHSHYRTGDAWPIYPFYDFQHPLSDALDGVTHSLCSLEFLDNRALYDWLVDRLLPSPQQPRQYEFGRRSLEYTVVSKRKLLVLVQNGHVDGWDDPRMPTLAGLRRRGVRPEAIRSFASRIGVSRTNRTVDVAVLEHAIREDLNDAAKRVMAVLEPLKVTLTNVSESSALDAPYWPYDVDREGSRSVPFGRELWIERSDFEEHPPKGFKRLAPGRAVRLRHAYVIVCDEVLKDAAGAATELRCHVLLDSLGQNPDGVRVDGAIHWLSATEALPAEIRLYDRLFNVADPDAGEGSFLDHLNADSRVVRQGWVEPSVATDEAETRYQFERLGYFWLDPQDGRGEHRIFNRILALKDTWGRRASTSHPADSAAATPESTRSENEAKGQPRAEHTADVGGDPGHPQDPRKSLDPAQAAHYDALRARHGLSPEDAAQLVQHEGLPFFFDAAVAASEHPQAVEHWVLNDMARLLKDRPLPTLAITPTQLAALVQLVEDKIVTLRVARELFDEVAVQGVDPAELVRSRGLERLDDDDAIRGMIADTLGAHPDELAAFRSGKAALRGFFVGQVMRAAGGKADPKRVQQLLAEALAGD